MSDKRMTIRNCPALRGWVCNEQFIKQDKMVACQDCTDCIMKQIVELCKEEIRVYRDTLHPNDGTNTLHFGRQSFAYDILKLLDIQEILE